MSCKYTIILNIKHIKRKKNAKNLFLIDNQRERKKTKKPQKRQVIDNQYYHYFRKTHKHLKMRTKSVIYGRNSVFRLKKRCKKPSYLGEKNSPLKQSFQTYCVIEQK